MNLERRFEKYEIKNMENLISNWNSGRLQQANSITSSQTRNSNKDVANSGRSEKGTLSGLLSDRYSTHLQRASEIRPRQVPSSIKDAAESGSIEKGALSELISDQSSSTLRQASHIRPSQARIANKDVAQAQSSGSNEKGRSSSADTSEMTRPGRSSSADTWEMTRAGGDADKHRGVFEDDQSLRSWVKAPSHGRKAPGGNIAEAENCFCLGQDRGKKGAIDALRKWVTDI